MDINNQVILIDGKDKTESISQIEEFEDRFELYYTSSSQLYTFKNKNRIVIKQVIKTDKIFNYWKSIATLLNHCEEPSDFMLKQLDSISYIHKESVLFSYLKNNAPISHKTLQDSIVFPFNFNLSQKRAIETAFTNNLSIIEGPPGTGKTQTILNILINLAFIQNKTVAVVSGNNEAVINVKEKLNKEGLNNVYAHLGRFDKVKDFFENLDSCQSNFHNPSKDIPTLLNELQSLNIMLNTLQEKKNQYAIKQQLLSSYNLEKEHFEEYLKNQEFVKIGKLPFYNQSPQRILSFLTDYYISTNKGEFYQIIFKIKLFFKYWFTDFKLLAKNEMTLILNIQKAYYSAKISNLESELSSIEDILKKSNFEDLLKLSTIISKEIMNQKIHDYYNTINQVTFSCETNNEDYFKTNKNYNNFIKRYPIILCTAHSIRNCIPSGFLFDYLIIDESSQLDLLASALALSCCKNAIIVGDTKQLPHVISTELMNKIKISNIHMNIPEPYRYDKHSLLSSLNLLYRNSIPTTILKEHYRCHPKIIGFCNQKYYNGELIPFTNESENDNPLLLYRTVKGNHMRQVNTGNKGLMNHREIDVILQEVLNNPKIDHETSNIGFATPYKKQVEVANEVFDEKIKSDTIHKYQGREKKTMILSTVLSNSYGGRNLISFIDNPNMINVAVSRAQDQFILVTDQSLFDTYGREIKDLIDYIEYTTLDENIVQSNVVSVFDLLYKDYSSSLKPFRRKLIGKSEYRSENIMETLINETLQEESYNNLGYSSQIFLKNLFVENNKLLTQEEQDYINQKASVDFIVFQKSNKKPILGIEVDGVQFHLNNRKQLKRDSLKKSIFKKYNLTLINFSTVGSNEKVKLQSTLNNIINNL